MATTIDKPRCTHREQKPVRRCLECGCFLRSYHDDSEVCDPCGRPEWTLTDDELFAALADTGYRQRTKAMDAVAELMTT